MSEHTIIRCAGRSPETVAEPPQNAGSVIEHAFSAEQCIGNAVEYACKYVPVELIGSFELEPALINHSTDSFELADKVIHRDVCAYARALVERRLRGPDTGIVLTDCCDSLRRAGDVLRAQGQKVFMLRLPHKDGPCARQLYKQELLRLIDEFSSETGKEFDLARFRAACERAAHRGRAGSTSGPSIALLGARVSDPLLERIRSLSPIPVANLTCTGNRRVGPAPQDENLDELMDWYAGELLSQPPCMRMADISPRRELLNDPNLCGVIYSTVSFCDYYGFEYAGLRKSLEVPLVKIETDYTGQADAQLENRLDAFFETLGPSTQVSAGSEPLVPKPGETRRRFETEAGESEKPSPGRTGTRFAGVDATTTCLIGYRDDRSRRDFEKGSVEPREAFYVAGVDSGSASTNAVILDGNRRLVSFASVLTGVNVPGSAKEALESALRNAGLDVSQLSRTVTTGYGRSAVKLGERDVTEITCHAKGAYFLNPAVRTVIDIGGQDSKVIRVHPDGSVREFAMNDKCAAGTGRFLEMMAQSLGVSLEELSVCGLKWSEEVAISSMCSVFAQSEVVSLIAAGKRLPDIAHGLYGSVASKVISLGGRAGMEPLCMMTGGVARNAGVVKAIEEKLGHRVEVPHEPEICGALGAALVAAEDREAAK